MEAPAASLSDDLYIRSQKRTLDLFLGNYGPKAPENVPATRLKLNAKINEEYGLVKDTPRPVAKTSKEIQIVPQRPPVQQKPVQQQTVPRAAGPHHFPSRPGVELSQQEGEEIETNYQSIIETLPSRDTEVGKAPQVSHGLVEYQKAAGLAERMQPPSQTRALAMKNPYAAQKPEWHPPWKLTRLISGHLGWVRAIAVDPSNEWFVTGAGDRTIKVWDLASGQLKLTLTGHISCVRGLAVSARHPYLFSCAEDKQVKCWDLESNKVIRHYHGHLSGVYCMALHPTVDVLITGGRDSTARVWDIRTKQAVHVLVGHSNTVSSVAAQGSEPQVITGSSDSTIRLWDLAKGQSITTLTHHKKSVRALAIHPTEYSMASASPDNIKHWKFPEGRFLKNFSGHNGIIHTLSVNRDNVLFSGADSGSMRFWDWRTGYCFQRLQTTVQPGSLDSEAGVMCSAFDVTGSRLICGEADKSIKVYKEDDEATPETHPIDETWKKDLKRW